MSCQANIIEKLIPQRINKLLVRIRGLIWRELTALDVVGGPVTDEFLSVKEAKRLQFSRVLPGEKFGPPNGGWRQRWFRLNIPAAESGQAGGRALFWSCMGETTAYIDGIPWAGLDVAHRYCVVPDRACQILLDCGTYQTAIWCPGAEPDAYGLRFDGACLKLRNANAWDAYHDLLVLKDLMWFLLKEAGFHEKKPWNGAIPNIEQSVPLLRMLLVDLNKAADAYDNGGLDVLNSALRRIYRWAKSEAWQIDVTLIGHSHLDLIWMWPEHIGLRKGVHTCATMLRHLERYSDFTVLQTSPAHVNRIALVEPVLFEKIRRQALKGRWEWTGGMILEADTNLPCGEALIRSFVYGQGEFAKLRGGKTSSVLWLPDGFGFSGVIPQLMRLSGITGFYTKKTRWNQINKFPYDSFIWRGTDGSEVLAHCLPGDEGWGASMPAEAIMAACAHRQAGVHPDLLAWVGIGDGGGGTTEGEIETANRMSDLARVPRTRWGSVESFFERMEKKQNDLPIYQGEIYLEYHRGTYTSRGAFKTAYRKAETGLMVNEAVRAITGKKPLGADAWDRVLSSQFHDVLPGSSILEVYKTMEPQLENVSQENLHEARKMLAGGDGVTVFNPVGVPRVSIVELPEKVLKTMLRAASAVDVPVQKNSNGKTMLTAVSLPAFGSVRLVAQSTGVASIPQLEPVQADRKRLSNEIITVDFNENGQLASFEARGCPLLIKQPAAFFIYPDNPVMFEAWDIDQPTVRLGTPTCRHMPLCLVEKGPVRAILRGKSRLGEKSNIEVDYILEAGSSVLRVEVRVDWKEVNRLLRYEIATGYCGKYARYGCPVGSILRPQQPESNIAEAMWEVPASRWAAATDDCGNGLALITEARYGFSCRAGVLGVSLLRSSVDSSENAMLDHGSHVIRFAIGRHQPVTDGMTLNTAAMADALFIPALVVEKGRFLESPVSWEEGPTLSPLWLLPSETGKGFILRLHETMGKCGTARLCFARPPLSVHLTDLMENKIKPCRKINGKVFELNYEPYKVLSIRQEK